MLRNKWLLPITMPKKAERLLVAFHYAAASASIFYPWRNFLAEDTLLYAVELPGRGTRYDEVPISDISKITINIAESIKPYLEEKIPVIFFGHSMGGILAYETALRLLANKYTIKHLIISAVIPPGYRQTNNFIHNLADEELKKKLINYGGIPKNMQQNLDYWKIYLPIARADFKMIANYIPANEAQRLPCDITALIGKDDKIVTMDQAMHWGKITNAKFKLVEIEQRFGRENAEKDEGEA